MSYLVFARKFRPQRFEDLLGQEPVVTTLRRAIEQKRIGHAYLFAGPRGTGKTSMARLFAKALNCDKGPAPAPCNTCPSCVEITEGRSLDVIEIDGASNRNIEDIRTLRENVKFSPVKGHFKVYIIDEFHQITSDAFNALLKTLEEPPAHAKFIFATTAPHKVPATIISRCQRYEFKRITQATILAKLGEIAKAEKIQAPEEACAAIARAAAGSLRDAESLLDQLAAFGQGRIRMEDVQALLGAVEDELLWLTTDAIIQRKPVAALGVVAQLADAGRDLGQFLTALIGHIRNLMVAKLGEGGQEMVEATPEAWKRLRVQADAFTDDELSYLFYVLVGTYDVMRRVGDARTPIEVALIRASRREPVAKISEMIRQLEQLPRGSPVSATASAFSRGPAGSPMATARGGGATAPSEPTPQPAASVTTETEELPIALEMLKSRWVEILNGVQQRKMSTAAYLLEAQPVAVAAHRLTIGFPKGFAFHKEALERQEHQALIEDVIRAVTGWSGRVEFAIVEELPTAAPPVPDEPMEEAPPPEATEAPEPPIVRAAAELFGGRTMSKRR